MVLFQGFLSIVDELAFSCVFSKPSPGALRLSDLIRACAGDPGPKEAALFFDAVLRSVQGKSVVWDNVAQNFGESIRFAVVSP